MTKNENIQKLIKTGAKAILAKSYYAVGLNEILAEANIPKGSFYYYFKSKEDFCIAIVEYYIEEHIDNCLSILKDTSLPATERLLRYFTKVRDFYLAQDCQQGCLLGKLTSEMSTLSLPLRQALQNGMEKWLGYFIFCLEDGVKRGEFSFSQPTAEVAGFISAAWGGCVARMQIIRSIQPLDIFINCLKSEILGYKNS
jgi:TetR/AcrR family transcriptional repressor of nem operon